MIQRLPNSFVIRATLTLLISLTALPVHTEAADSWAPSGSSSGSAPLSQGARVFVRTLALSGNTLFSDDQLTAAVADYLGQYLATEELEAVRNALSRYYVERGYLSSGALLPDQRVEGGVVRFEIIEGRVSEVRVEGLERLDSHYLKERLWPNRDEVLSLQRLQQRVLLLHRDPLLQRVRVQVLPGLRRGETVLLAEASEAESVTLWLEANNHRSPDVGSEQAILRLEQRNLTGRGDRLSVALAHSEGIEEINLDYQLPLAGGRWGLQLGGEAIQGDVVEDELESLEIESDSNRVRAGVTLRPIQRSDQLLELGFTLERARNRTRILDQPFSFSSGAERGESVVTTLRLDQSWLSRSPDQVLALSSTISLGIDAFGATVHNDERPDSQFLTWLAQAQWSRALGQRELILRALTRLADDELLPLERLGVGGPQSVRGYREGLLIRDQGLLLSGELQLPLGSRRASGGWYWAPFLDLGEAWNHGAESERSAISSVGVGLLWRGEQLDASLYFGAPLNDVKRSENSLQEEGILFSLSYRPR